MTSKSQKAYNHGFNSLLQILNDFNIEASFENKIITTDYEKSLRNSINKILKPNQLNGRYFHFSKALWKKCRVYGLTAKKFRKDSILFTFCLKLYPFIHNNERNCYIEKLENFINGKDARYRKFLKYFLKNWVHNKSYNFNRISNTNYEKRTNNICETFHRTLNKQMPHFHSKISFLADKLKFFAIEAIKNII